MPSSLHISPGKLIGISRILKEADSLACSGLFDRVIVVGHHATGLPTSEHIGQAVELVRVPALSGEKHQLGIVRLIWFVVWGFRILWRFKRADISCVNAHSISVLPVAWIVALTNRAKLVYDTHELETETASLRGHRKRLAKLVERVFISRCDLVITVTAGISSWYASAYPGLAPVVVRNVPDASRTEGSQIPLRDMLSVPDHALLFVHTGHLATARSIPAIIQAFSQQNVQHHVLFLGGGVLEDEVQEAVEKQPNIHLLAPVDHREVVSWVAAADVGLCLIENTSTSYEYALPNKLFESLLAKVSLISTYLVEAHHLLGDEYLDLCIEDVHRDLDELIRSFDADKLRMHRTTGRSWLVPSWQEESRRMISAYSELGV